MASHTQSRLLVELSPYSLQLARVEGDRLEAFRECARDPAAVAAALAEILPAGIGANPVSVLFAPSANFLLLANADDAAAIRSPKGLLTYAGNAAHGFSGPLNVSAWDSASGLRVDPVGSEAWTIALTTSAEVEAAKAQLASFGLPVESLRLALPTRMGSVVTALQDMPESTRVVLWDLGETSANLVLISAGGDEAASQVAAGFRQIFEAVQAGLGLKFRAAAAKLFFNADYDFAETAGPIAERLALLLRPAIAALGGPATTLQVTGLPAGQTWLAKAVASALDLTLLAPDVPAFSLQCGLSGNAINASLPTTALGLVFEAAPDASGENAWRPGWLEAAPAAAPLPASAPIASSSAASAPAEAPASQSGIKPLITLFPTPAGAAPQTVASAATATALAVEADAPKVAPVVKPLFTGVPATKPAPVIATTVAAATAPIAAPVPALVAAVKPVTSVVEAVEIAPKKKSGLIIAVVAVVVLLAAGGGFFAMNGSSKAVAAAPQLSAEEQRLMEVEDARLLAEELKSPRSFRNDRYSFEISDRGLITKLNGTKFTPLVDEFGWFELQGSIQGAGGKQEWFNGASMSDRDYKTTINKTVRNGAVVFEVTGTHPRFKLETLITCLQKSVKVRTVFTPINMTDPRGALSGVLSVKMTRKSLVPGQKTTVENGGLSFATEVGPVSVTFNNDVWGRSGDEGKQTVAAGSNLVFFYFAGQPDAKRNVLESELLLP